MKALDALQFQLWRVITEPSGIDERGAEVGEVAALLRGDRAASPAERIGVYANAYWTRLHDVLADDFGALARALGPAAFHDLAKTYGMMHPPERPSLRHAGARLAEHLAEPPFAEIFARVCPYAGDLARLEWAIAQAFFAPDVPALEREALAELAPEAWPELRFEITPSLALLHCAWPVHEVRERFEREGESAGWSEAPALAAGPTDLRVWRRDERVRFARIAPRELAALAALRAGETFAQLCDRLAAEVGEADAAREAAALLSDWIAAGLLVRVLPADERS